MSIKNGHFQAVSTKSICTGLQSVLVQWTGIKKKDKKSANTRDKPRVGTGGWESRREGWGGEGWGKRVPKKYSLLKSERLATEGIWRYFTQHMPVNLTLSNCQTLSLTVGAVLEEGFPWMFAILHDNMWNARDTNQAVNGSLSIFLCVPFLELLMQWFGLVLWHIFSIACVTGTLSSKQHGGIQVKAQFELH